MADNIHGSSVTKEYARVGWTHIHDADQTPKDDDECEDENGVVDPLRLKIKEHNKRAFA